MLLVEIFNSVNILDCCRQRKLERIAQLDGEVAQLKEENINLTQVHVFSSGSKLFF